MVQSTNTASPGENAISASKLALIEKLREQASLFANSLEMGAQAVLTEKERLEERSPGSQDRYRLAFFKREREAALWAPMRLDIYRLELLRHPVFCPYCWMLEGERVLLKPMLESGEVLACDVCGSAY